MLVGKLKAMLDDQVVERWIGKYLDRVKWRRDEMVILGITDKGMW
jgi:hypothetical protein